MSYTSLGRWIGVQYRTLKGAVSKVLHLLKGASARSILQSLPELRVDAKTDHLWQKRYGSKSVELPALASVRNYIRSQKERPEKYER